MDAILALKYYRRRKFDEAIDVSTRLLERNSQDQAAWYIKCRSLIGTNWIDDTDLEEDDISEVLLAVGRRIASDAKPQTSLHHSLSSKGSGGQSLKPNLRPSTKSGRPSTGMLRRRTENRGGDGDDVSQVFKGDRPTTSRPVTQSGRFVRLNTATLANTSGSEFVQVERLNLQKYSTIPTLSRSLCDYMLFVSHNPKLAFELASLSTKNEQFTDWWWQNRLAKSYFQMGLLRDAERQLRASIRNQHMTVSYLDLAKIFIKLDQPLNAIEVYSKGYHNIPHEPHLILGKARVYEQLGDLEKMTSFYKQVLELDSSNIESIACIATNCYYEDQPELALRLFRRLLQMGVSSHGSIWNNLALCCLASSQYDMVVSCFENALNLSEFDENIMTDVWYNIGHLGISSGDLEMAFECFKIAVNLDANHAESLNCLGVLEMRKGNVKKARQYYMEAKKVGGKMIEPTFNLAVLCYKTGDLKNCHDYLKQVISVNPGISQAQEMLKSVEKEFS